MTTLRWKTVESYLTADLVVTARFGLDEAKAVREFRMALHRRGDPSQWLVRFETHGGRAHKHVRWDDVGEERHKPLKGWPLDLARILDRARQDLKENWQEYEGRYRAWMHARD